MVKLRGPIALSPKTVLSIIIGLKVGCRISTPLLAICQVKITHVTAENRVMDAATQRDIPMKRDSIIWKTSMKINPRNAQR